jgi:uncharacterized protein YcbX
VHVMGDRGTPTLDHIVVYPIKSARGTPLTEAELDTTGPVLDRRWMLVDKDGRFLSQRRIAALALITPRFGGGALTVAAPGLAPLAISAWQGEGEWIPVRLWRDHLTLPAPSSDYDEWFSTALRETCRLVHLPSSVLRPVEAPFDRDPWRVSLADAYPLLVLGQGSIDTLNEKLPEPIEFDRFRPNFVIGNIQPHEEDSWKKIRVGDVEIAVVKPCARCSTVLVDQATGERGLEPLRTLAQYRRKPTSVVFAQNGLVTKPGLVRVGDPVIVLEYADSPRAT